MKYYFWVKETEQHDEELAIIDSWSLEKAKKDFANEHPEDVENIKYITEENGLIVA